MFFSCQGYADGPGEPQAVIGGSRGLAIKDDDSED